MIRKAAVITVILLVILLLSGIIYKYTSPGHEYDIIQVIEDNNEKSTDTITVGSSADVSTTKATVETSTISGVIEPGTPTGTQSNETAAQLQGSLEKKIYDLFQDKGRRIQILDLIGGIDWSKYEKVSNNNSMELLEWIRGLELKDKKQVKNVLNAQKGLDGAYAEEYSIILGDLFGEDGLKLIRYISELRDDLKKNAIFLLAYNLSYSDNEKKINELSELAGNNEMTKDELKVVIGIIYCLTEY